MSRPSPPDIMTGTGRAARPAAVPTPRRRDRLDSWPRTGSDVAGALPRPGQPGHGPAAVLRNQPARIVDGRIQGGYNDVYELICPSCGDNPDLDYLYVPPRLQWLRGPRTLEEGLAAYHKHLGIPWDAEDRTGRSGPG